MTSDQLKNFIENLNQLPTLSPVALKIVEIAGDEESSVREISRLIESDIALSSKILRIANYALARSGRSGAVSTVKRAASVLGLNMVRSIALSLIVINIFDSKNSKVFNLVEFWRHSAACAIASELFARRFSYPQPEEAFIAGLLHDLGKLIFFQWKGDEYERIVSDAGTYKVRLLELEEKKLGIGHTQAAKILMEHWKFPQSLSIAAWLHHQPLAVFKSNRFEQLPFIVKCADSLCHIQRFGESGNPLSDLDKDQLRMVTGLSEEDMSVIASDVLKLFDEVSVNYNWDGTTPDLYLSAVARANQELIELQIELSETKGQLAFQQRANNVIADLQESLSIPMSIVEATEKIVSCLGDLIPFKRIMAFVFMENENVLEGSIKVAIREKVEKIRLPFDGNINDLGKRTKLREQIAILEHTIINLKDSSPVHKDIMDALRSPDLKVQPMFVGGVTLGMIMIEMAPSELTRFAKGVFLRKFALSASIALERFIVINKLNNELERAVQMDRKTENFQTRLYQAERLASVGRLAAEAAHEINNPLSAISLKAQILMGQLTNEADRKPIKLIVEQTERISKIIKDLMGVARPSEPKIEPTSLEFVIDQALSLLENRILLSGIKISKQFDVGVPLINVDAKQMEQVFLNMVINAMQAMQSGGVLTIFLSDDKEAKHVCISFSDTGLGIDPKDIPNIFDPFYSSKKDKGGTGLGLAICYSIIESHNGTIRVSSTPRNGTTFLITLPVDLGGKVNKPVNKENGSLNKEKKVPKEMHRGSVLIIDDEEVLRSVLSDALESNGYHVSKASDAAEGVSKITNGQFDVVLLDLRMPGKDGIFVLETFKKKLSISQNIIVISGTTNEEDFTKAKKAGAFACLRKPFDIEDLLSVIDKAVQSLKSSTKH